MISSTILTVYGLLGLAWSWRLTTKSRSALVKRSVPSFLIPGLVLAPVSIAITYKLTGLTLISGGSSEAPYLSCLPEMLIASMIIFIASGTMNEISIQTKIATLDLKKTQFPKSLAALGLDSKALSRRFVFLRSIVPAFLNTYSTALGELIIVEAMFNLPGVGSRIWKRAQTYQLESLGLYLFLFLAMFVGGQFLIQKLQSWVQNRTEGYES